MKLAAYLLVLLANLLGGISYLWTKLALEAMPDAPATINFGRVCVGVLCAWVWLGARKTEWPSFARADLVRVSIVGAACCAAPLYLGTLGVTWSTTGNAAILILVEPAAILVFSWMLLRERLRWFQSLGIAVIAAGAVSIIGGEVDLERVFAPEYTRGNIVLVLHGILWGLYTPIFKPLAGRFDAMVLTFAVLLCAAIALAPGAVLERDAWANAPAPGTAILWIVLLGVLLSFVATLLWNYSLVHLPAPAVAPFVLVQPLAGVLAGALVLDEPITRSIVIGGALIILGVLPVLYTPGPSEPRS